LKHAEDSGVEPLRPMRARLFSKQVQSPIWLIFQNPTVKPPSQPSDLWEWRGLNPILA